MPRVVVGRVPATAPKLCQKLRPYPPTLTDATDAEIQHFRRWPTPTDARKWLPKQVRYPSGRNSLLLPKQREVNGATAHDDADDVSARGTPSPYFLRTAHNGLCRCPITFMGCRRLANSEPFHRSERSERRRQPHCYGMGAGVLRRRCASAYRMVGTSLPDSSETAGRFGTPLEVQLSLRFGTIT